MRIGVLAPQGVIGGNAWAISSGEGMVLLDFGITLEWRRFVPTYPIKDHHSVMLSGSAGILPDVELLTQFRSARTALNIVVTHAHWDHYAALSLLTQYGLLPANIIVGDARLRDKFDWVITKLSGTAGVMPTGVSFLTGPQKIATISIDLVPVRHSIPLSYAVTVTDTEGSGVLYSGDFRRFETDIEVTLNDFFSRARRRAAFICEGTFVGERVELALWEEALERAKSIILERPDDLFFVSIGSAQTDVAVWLVDAFPDQVRFHGTITTDLMRWGDVIDWRDRLLRRRYALINKARGNVLVYLNLLSDSEYVASDEFQSVLDNRRGHVHVLALHDLEFDLARDPQAAATEEYLRARGVYVHTLYARGHAEGPEVQRVCEEFLHGASAAGVKSAVIIPTHTRHPEVFAQWFGRDRVALPHRSEIITL